MLTSGSSAGLVVGPWSRKFDGLGNAGVRVLFVLPASLLSLGSATGSWSNGVASNLTLTAAALRAAVADGPFNAAIGVAPVDSDGVALDSFDLASAAGGAHDRASVGTAALQIAKAAGAKVIAGVSTDEKAARCRALGADETLNYSTQPVRETLKALTGGAGPDVVYDAVGGDLAEPVFRSIAWRGRYLVIGFAQGGIPNLPLNLPLLKGASLVGVFWGEFARREPQANARMLAELAQWYARGLVKPVIDQRLPMTALPEAFARMGTRKVRGKLVLVND